MPLEGGGRLVVEMTPDEAAALRDAIQGATASTDVSLLCTTAPDHPVGSRCAPPDRPVRVPSSRPVCRWVASGEQRRHHRRGLGLQLLPEATPEGLVGPHGIDPVAEGEVYRHEGRAGPSWSGSISAARSHATMAWWCWLRSARSSPRASRARACARGSGRAREHPVLALSDEQLRARQDVQGLDRCLAREPLGAVLHAVAPPPQDLDVPEHEVGTTAGPNPPRRAREQTRTAWSAWRRLARACFLYLGPQDARRGLWVVTLQWRERDEQTFPVEHRDGCDAIEQTASRPAG